MDLAARFASITLGHVTREYPNLLSHALAGPEDAGTPRALHPVFYGSYDWHSCVHGYWLLAFLQRRFPSLPQAAAIAALFDARITPDAVSAERAYFERPHARGFERPYGWAWLLKLRAELFQHTERRWAEALAPLADLIAERARGFFAAARYPVRTGTHPNTAFALALMADDARAAGNAAFLGVLGDAARRWYGGDRDCQAWEPSGDDFLSSALIEAECMRRLLPPGDFLAWFRDFLPRLPDGDPATLFTPVTVGDRSDGKIAHLDGLNLSRAWCWRSLAHALPDDAGRRAAARTAETHLASGLPHLASDYMGEHWLCTFAALALDA